MLAQLEEPRQHVLVGQSPRIRQILKLVDKLGHCRWPVLLLGETGTGKKSLRAPFTTSTRLARLYLSIAPHWWVL